VSSNKALNTVEESGDNHLAIQRISLHITVTKESTKMMSSMAMEPSSGRLATNTLALTRTMSVMASAPWSGSMVASTKACGRKVSKMVLAS